MDAEVSGIGVEAIEYHHESETVRTQFDQAQTPASLAVIATLAEIMDADPVDLEPLQFTIDPDALDALVCVRNGMTGDIHVSFTHEAHPITVSSYGVVTIGPGHELNAENSEKEPSRI